VSPGAFRLRGVNWIKLIEGAHRAARKTARLGRFAPPCGSRTPPSSSASTPGETRRCLAVAVQYVAFERQTLEPGAFSLHRLKGWVTRRFGRSAPRSWVQILGALTSAMGQLDSTAVQPPASVDLQKLAAFDGSHRRGPGLVEQHAALAK
jgi:hypothetical protein